MTFLTTVAPLRTFNFSETILIPTILIPTIKIQREDRRSKATTWPSFTYKIYTKYVKSLLSSGKVYRGAKIISTERDVKHHNISTPNYAN